MRASQLRNCHATAAPKPATWTMVGGRVRFNLKNERKQLNFSYVWCYTLQFVQRS